MSELADLVETSDRFADLYARLRDGNPAALQGVMQRLGSLKASQPKSLAHAERFATALACLPRADREALARELASCARAREAPTTSLQEREMLLVREQILRTCLLAGESAPRAGAPKIVHLVKTDSDDRDLPLVQYLCYRSVVAHCQGYRILLHTPSIPEGARWKALLADIEPVVAMPPQWLGNRRLMLAAHQSDVWRVRKLIQQGGIYLDWDLLLLRPPDALLGNVCAMALEKREPGYQEVLGNAALVAEPGSVFLSSWLEEMAIHFNPAKYTAHSVLLARRLAIKRPALVRTLPFQAFYDPGWTDEAMRLLFDPARKLPPEALEARFAQSVGMHLFCSHENFLRYSASLTERDIAQPRCNLALLMKPYL